MATLSFNARFIMADMLSTSFSSGLPAPANPGCYLNSPLLEVTTRSLRRSTGENRLY